MGKILGSANEIIGKNGETEKGKLLDWGFSVELFGISCERIIAQ